MRRKQSTINAFFSSGPFHPRQAGELSEPAAKSERKWVEHGLLLDFLSAPIGQHHQYRLVRKSTVCLGGAASFPTSAIAGHLQPVRRAEKENAPTPRPLARIGAAASACSSGNVDRCVLFVTRTCRGALETPFQASVKDDVSLWSAAKRDEVLCSLTSAPCNDAAWLDRT